MKILSTLFIIALIAVPAFAQVTTTPEFATENDHITITFDATQGGGGMAGYNGTLYTHTGVITNMSGGNWSHVIGSWGNNSTQPALTRVAPDLYELVIGNPRQFYGVSNPGERIEKLAFVFRSADANQQTEDIFAPIYEAGLSVIMIEPQVSVDFGNPLRSPVFANPDDTVKVRATAAQLGVQLTSLSLEINGNQVASVSSDTLEYDLVAANFGGFTNVSVIGTDDQGGVDEIDFVMMINPDHNLAAPPAGTKPGINYNSSASVTLALFAPYKDFVYVVSDLTDWHVDASYFMNKHEVNADSVLWWLTINGVNPGTEYGFQYLVDGNIRVADPYTDKVLDPWNDSFIPTITYPNLKAYPEGKTAEAVSVFQTDQTPYSWQHSANYQRPDQNELVIYELLVRDFIARHDFQTLKDTLDYLENLGVNAIELMPFNEFEGNESWGYNPSFFFAPDKYYGPKDVLKAFIDECHRRNIAVIMDIVLNHAYGQNVMARMYWNAQTSRPASNNPWFNVVSPNPVFAWGNDFDHESIHTKAFVDRVNHYWLTEYKVDGFRFDFTKGFTNTPGDGGGHDNARINILKRMADELWAIDDSAYIILEHFAPNSEEKILAEYGSKGMMVWGNMNYNYNEATMGYHENGKSDFSWGYYGNRSWGKANLVTYMESHDEERLMFKNLQYGNSSGGYNIKTLPTALDRLKLAGAFFFTIPGPKMIWQFGEVGYDVSIDDPCRVCNKPIRWNYFTQSDRNRLYKTWAALLKLRKNNAAFRDPGSYVTMSLNDASGKKRIGIIHNDMQVVIIGNFGVADQSINPQFFHTGKWYDYFSGDSTNVTNVTAPITLAPGVFHIYTDVRQEAPEPGLVLGLAERNENSGLPAKFALHANYPNPFNPETTIEFDVAKTSVVKLTIYNVLGEEILTLANEQLSPGSYHLHWDATDNNGQAAASGIYFLRMTADNFTQHRRMLLVR